jgi:glycosyltransferase involved in cell wall biosynthesis
VRVLFLPDYSAANAYQRSLSEGLEAEGVTVTADPTRPRRLLPITEAMRSHGRPDIIHLHWTEPYVAGARGVSRLKAERTLMELRSARRFGVKVVWTAHDLFRHDAETDATERRFMRSLYDLADAVIVHCDSARDDLAEALNVPATGRDRIRVIPHGHYAGAYPDDISRAGARQRLDLPADSLVIAFVGWVRPYKGVTELTEAFSAVEAPGARLLIAGRALDDDYAARLTALVDADARASLWLGFVPDDKLQVYLRAADVVATPFLEIFTSGSVLLAMSFERGVIAPRRGCVADVLDDAGAILYDADDPRGLEGALRVALTVDLEALGRHNGSRLEEYGWDRVAAATRSVYEDVTARR